MSSRDLTILELKLQQICEIDEFVWWQSLIQELKEPKRSLALALMCMLIYIVQLDAYCKSRWLQGMSLHMDYDYALLPVQACVCVLSASRLLPAIVELELVRVLCCSGCTSCRDCGAMRLP